MEMAIALVVVAVIGFVPSFMQARAAKKAAQAATIEALAAKDQTATSNGIKMGTMVEAIYNRQERMERNLDKHIESPRAHQWDPSFD